MKINKISVLNFKSLHGVELDLDLSFNCLIGLNGSGKTTVLQLLDFIKHLVHGRVEEWLNSRGWEAEDLLCKLDSQKEISLYIEFVSTTGEAAVWDLRFDPRTLQCKTESLGYADKRSLLDVHSEGYYIQNSDDVNERDQQRIIFDYQGSILSALKPEMLPPLAREVKEYISGIQSLELLSPDQLHRRTREANGSIGIGGEKLSAFIHEMDPVARQELVELLKAAYPRLSGFNLPAFRSGWKGLGISEEFINGNLETDAAHINDGMLRLIAIFAQLSVRPSLLILDEIENGINVELVELLMDTLVKSPTQVLVTTHSPVILNFLDDSVAKNGVTYLFKNESGITRATKFFDIPSMAEKLSIMGPGEAYEDTSLFELNEELISALPDEEEE